MTLQDLLDANPANDLRIDHLKDALLDLLDQRARGQDIPYLSVIGLLEKIKHDLLQELE